MKETDDFGDLCVAGKDIKMHRKEIRREGVENYNLFKIEIFGFYVYMYTRFSKNYSGPRSIDHPDSYLMRFRQHLSVPKSLSSLHYLGFSGRIWTFYSNRIHSLLCSEDALIYWVSSQVV
jgi:hypothetical protein